MVKVTLLIVDDEVAIRDMIRISLEHAGFNVISAKKFERSSR
jgi:DNA-binding response OmpR family regulator